MYNSGIYRIVNLKNNKCYVGQTTNLKKRKISHFSKLRAGKHENPHLQLSFNKYGLNAFDFEIVCRCPESELDEKEIYYINLFKSKTTGQGYNMQSGGETNKHLSEETKQLLSSIKRGKPSWNKGKHFDDETRLKISKSHKGLLSGEKHPQYGKRGEKSHWYGLKHTEESIEKMQIAAKKRNENPEYIKKLKETSKKKEEHPGWKNGNINVAIEEYKRTGKAELAAKNNFIGIRRFYKTIKDLGLSHIGKEKKIENLKKIQSKLPPRKKDLKTGRFIKYETV